ncbi:MAG TPA: hypothetical protein VI585_29360 [Candidatus Binatia bacterium]
MLFRSALLISSPLRDYSGNPKPLRDPDIPAQEIVVPRLTSRGTTPSQGYGQAVDRVEAVEDLEAALEQFHEIATDLGGEATKETT